MDLSSNSLFGMITKRMDYLSQRQQVLAQNIANANTPNYRAQDMKESSFAKALVSQKQTVAPAITNQAHLQPIRANTHFGLNRGQGTYETAPDGNSVIIEEQSNKLAQNQIDYATATTLYTKYIGMMKMAIK